MLQEHMFTVLTKPFFKPCRCRQRPWLRIAFPLVRRRSSLASCRIDLHAGQTKSCLTFYCEAALILYAYKSKVLKAVYKIGVRFIFLSVDFLPWIEKFIPELSILLDLIMLCNSASSSAVTGIKAGSEFMLKYPPKSAT
jgi:hypothetical protein